MSIQRADPLNVSSRLYKQVADLLTRLENKDDLVTTRERIAALAAIGRLVAVVLGKDHNERESGTTVRKYAKAFPPDAPHKRTRGAGSRRAQAEPEPDDDPDPFADDDPDDAA